MMKKFAALKNVLLSVCTFSSLATYASASPAVASVSFRCSSGEAGFGTLDLRIGSIPATTEFHGAMFTTLDITRYDVSGKLVETRHTVPEGIYSSDDEDFQARLDTSTGQYYLRVPPSHTDWTSPHVPTTSCFSTSTTPGAWLNIVASTPVNGTTVALSPNFISGELNPNHTWASVNDGVFYQNHPVVNGKVCPMLSPSKSARYPINCVRLN